MTTYFIQVNVIQNSPLGINVFVLHNRSFVYNFRNLKYIETALWNIFNLTIYSSEFYITIVKLEMLYSD